MADPHSLDAHRHGETFVLTDAPGPGDGSGTGTDTTESSNHHSHRGHLGLEVDVRAEVEGQAKVHLVIRVGRVDAVAKAGHPALAA